MFGGETKIIDEGAGLARLGEAAMDAGLDRRQLLAGISASALFLHAHAALGSGLGRSVGQGRRPGKAGDPRILALELLTATPLEAMATYYGDTLGLPVRTEETTRLVVTAGATEITFVAAAEGAGSPFYHFAFNIPENKILSARTWQLERTPLFLTPENLRDPAYPDDVRHFRSWNAHSIFFWDPAGNVLEYIARHDLDIGSAGGFDTDDILYASEIGFVVDDVPASAAAVQKGLDLPSYRPGSDAFWATGDERGLLLHFQRGREIGDRLRGRPAPVGVFPTHATIRGRGGAYEFSGFPYAVAVRG